MHPRVCVVGVAVCMACGGASDLSVPVNAAALVTDHPGIGGVAIDSQNVWFSDAQGLWHSPKEGGPAELVWTGGAIMSLAADDAGVCWSALAEGPAHALCLRADAVTPFDLGPLPLAALPTRAMVMTAHRVYFSDVTTNVWSADREAPGVTLLAPGVGYALALDDSALWASSRTGVRRIPLDGGAPTDWSFTTAAPAALASCGGTLYASLVDASDSNGTLIAMSTDAMGPIRTVTTGLKEPEAIACTASDVYVTELARLAITRCDASGASCSTFARPVENAALALDGSRVFFTDSFTSSLYVRAM